MSTTTNGRPQRKQLSDQIDRLDTILDGLGEGLNGAIADAVRDGTRLALKDAVIEILTDPTLRSKLQHAAAPESSVSPPKANFWVRLKSSAKAAAYAVQTAALNALRATAAGLKATIQMAKHPARLLGLARHFKSLLCVGAGVGLAVAIVSYIAPHAVSATLAGVTGGVAAIAVRVAIWTGSTIRSIKLA